MKRNRRLCSTLVAGIGLLCGLIVACESTDDATGAAGGAAAGGGAAGTGGAGAAGGAGATGGTGAVGGAGATGGSGGTGAGGTGASGATLLSQFSFENNVEDSLGYANASVYPSGDPDDLVSYAPGFSGMAVRSSHNDDDGGGDFEISHYGPGWPATNEIFLRYRLKLESDYENCSGGGIVNFKQFWTLGDSGHHEIILQGLTSSTIGIDWIITGDGAGWDGGTTVTSWGGGTPYTRGDWMKIEIYIKLSTGADHLNADGICLLKVDDGVVHYATDVVTGAPGPFRCPALKATCDCPSGSGWWQLDEYEAWDGLPTADIVPALDPRGPRGQERLGNMNQRIGVWVK